MQFGASSASHILKEGFLVLMMFGVFDMFFKWVLEFQNSVWLHRMIGPFFGLNLVVMHTY
jgi:hypothetical protein